MELQVKGVILAGGEGARLWPTSRSLAPKHLLSNEEGYSLFQLSVLRALKLGISDLIVVSEYHQRFYLKEQLAALQLDDTITISIFVI